MTVTDVAPLLLALALGGLMGLMLARAIAVAVGLGFFFIAGLVLSALSGWSFLFWGVVAPVVGFQLAYFAGAAFAVAVLGAGAKAVETEAIHPAPVKGSDGATA